MWIRKGKGRAGYTVSALTKVENVSDDDGYGSKETLVATFELALIKDLDLNFRRFSNGAVEGGVRERDEELWSDVTVQMSRSNRE